MTVRATFRSVPARIALCTAALMLAGTAWAQPQLMANGRAQMPCAPYGCIGISLNSVNAQGDGQRPATMPFAIFERSNTAPRMDGVDLRVIANLLLIPNVDAYARIGNRYAVPATESTGVRYIESAESLQESDWTYGAGVQYHFSPDWSLSADWDQYRVNLPAQREQQSVYSVGTRYRF